MNRADRHLVAFREHPGRLKVIKVNVDDNRALSQRLGAMSIPTMVVMKDGRELDRIVGAMPKPALEARVMPFLGKPSPTGSA